MNKVHVLAMAASAAAIFAIPASAQNVNGRPNYGTVNLRSGFAPDPRVVAVTSGGGIDASRVRGRGVCRGFISAAPDVRVVYVSGNYPLIISVDSNSDTTLVVNGPDGGFSCDDDGGERGLNPSIRYDNPRSGRYEIWVGSYRAGTNARARVHISEVGSQ
jgi:hypothetical protein